GQVVGDDGQARRRAGRERDPYLEADTRAGREGAVRSPDLAVAPVAQVRIGDPVGIVTRAGGGRVARDAVVEWRASRAALGPRFFLALSGAGVSGAADGRLGAGLRDFVVVLVGRRCFLAVVVRRAGVGFVLRRRRCAFGAVD